MGRLGWVEYANYGTSALYGLGEGARALAQLLRMATLLCALNLVCVRVQQRQGAGKRQAAGAAGAAAKPAAAQAGKGGEAAAVPAGSARSAA